jgi:hypothetical protein
MRDWSLVIDDFSEEDLNRQVVVHYNSIYTKPGAQASCVPHRDCIRISRTLKKRQITLILGNLFVYNAPLSAIRTAGANKLAVHATRRPLSSLRRDGSGFQSSFRGGAAM